MGFWGIGGMDHFVVFIGLRLEFCLLPFVFSFLLFALLGMYWYI